MQAWSFPWPREGEAEASQYPTASLSASLAAAPCHRSAGEEIATTSNGAAGDPAPLLKAAQHLDGVGRSSGDQPSLPSQAPFSQCPLTAAGTPMGRSWLVPGMFSSPCKQEELLSCPKPGQPRPGGEHLDVQNPIPIPFCCAVAHGWVGAPRSLAASPAGSQTAGLSWGFPARSRCSQQK